MDFKMFLDESGLIQNCNLSKNGDCSVYDNAKVTRKDKAEVRGNTKAISTATVGKRTKRTKLDSSVFSIDVFSSDSFE